MPTTHFAAAGYPPAGFLVRDAPGVQSFHLQSFRNSKPICHRDMGTIQLQLLQTEWPCCKATGASWHPPILLGLPYDCCLTIRYQVTCTSPCFQFKRKMHKLSGAPLHTCKGTLAQRFFGITSQSLRIALYCIAL